MPLSLDKIKSLIRLANNNPDENEANLAARKVCRELAGDRVEQVHQTPRTAFGKMNEGFFTEWTDPRTGDMNIKITNLDLHNSENNRIIEILKMLKQEIAKPRTWNDVKRSTEPEWRSHRPTGAGKDPFEHFRAADFGKGFEEWFKKHGFSAQYAPEPEDNPFYRPSQAQENFFYGGGKEKKRQETRVCSKCGLEVSTYRVKENPFICNPCHWAAGKKETTP